MLCVSASPETPCDPCPSGSGHWLYALVLPVPQQYDGARGWVWLCPVSRAAPELGSCSVSTTSGGLLATERQSL